MHSWGDTDFDWESLDKAIRLVASFMLRWGRIGVSAKDKYGTARIDVSFYHGGFHELVYPGYVYAQWPDWLWGLENKVFHKFTKFIGFNRLLLWWQKKIYNRAYQKAIKNFPKLIPEILIAADYPALINKFDFYMSKYRQVERVRRMLEIP